MSTPIILPITERLALIPAKIGKKLLGQFNLGHLDAPTLHTVLDAAELAGDVNKSLWFASSYLFLRSKGIPVGDVVAMAKLHNRRLCLEWSEQRWVNEHNKLSRLSTLKMLAAKNELYDVRFFEERLAKNYPGYLIKSSRRLGMEGLRQQHCVASYHDRLMSGQTAIVCLFVDKTRWTVELLRAYSNAGTLRIGQIKSVRNAVAGEDVRRCVHEALGITYDAPIPMPNDGRALHEINLMALLPLLTGFGISEVYVSFSGSGDDGCIDYVRLEPQPDVMPTVTIIDKTRDFDDGRWITHETIVEKPLNDAMEHIVYGYLEMSGVDWVNNDGGQGHFSIDFETGDVEFEVNTNYTEVITGYANEWSVEYLLAEASSLPEAASS